MVNKKGDVIHRLFYLIEYSFRGGTSKQPVG